MVVCDKTNNNAGNGSYYTNLMKNLLFLENEIPNNEEKKRINLVVACGEEKIKWKLSFCTMNMSPRDVPSFV